MREGTMRWRTGILAAVLVAAGGLPAKGQSRLDFSAGAGPVVAAGGSQFLDPVPFEDVGPALNAAFRWPIRKGAYLGVGVEWARFPFAEPGGVAGAERKGAREYICLGAAGRWYFTFDASAPYGFVGAALGMARERLTRGGVCTNEAQSPDGPCDSYTDDTGAWWGGEVGLSVPVGWGLHIDLSAVLSGAVMGAQLESAGPDITGATWVGLRLAVGGALW
jgi:hypothetical protein